MTIKKIISVGLCVLTLSASSVLPASAAKSADPKNEQIANKVEQFNNSRLKTLDAYIWQIGTDSEIIEDLMSLYKRLDSLMVSNINTANSLAIPITMYDTNSIGSQLDLLFARLYQINTNLKFVRAEKRSTIKTLNYWLLHKLNNNILNAEANAKRIINTLNAKIDEIEKLND